MSKKNIPVRVKPIEFIEKILKNTYFSVAMPFFVILSAVGHFLSLGFLFWFSFVILIVSLIFAAIEEFNKLIIYSQDFIPIPIIINISNAADSKEALNRMFKYIKNTNGNKYKHHKNNLRKLFGIEEDDLIFAFKGDIEDKEYLKDFLKILKHDVEKLENRIPIKNQFYLVYIGPVSVAILVGAIFATDPVTIFQQDKSNYEYFKVYEVNDRSLKENVESFEKFSLEPIRVGNDKKVTLAIDISSHKINLNQSQIISYGDVFYLKSKSEKGTIDKDEDWGQYVREIFKELNVLQRNYDEIKLVYSMPVAIAIMIGIAIQNYWKITLTQYGNGEYKDLIKTNEIIYRL